MTRVERTYYIEGIEHKHYIQLYDTPRVGVFKLPSDEYISGSWDHDEGECKIIGETDTCFIEREVPLSYGWWFGDTVKQINTIVQIGPHKSRLVKWIDTQLTLF